MTTSSQFTMKLLLDEWYKETIVTDTYSVLALVIACFMSSSNEALVLVLRSWSSAAKNHMSSVKCIPHARNTLVQTLLYTIVSVLKPLCETYTTILHLLALDFVT